MLSNVHRFRPLDGESISKRPQFHRGMQISDISRFRPLDGESISKPLNESAKWKALHVSVP